MKLKFYHFVLTFPMKCCQLDDKNELYQHFGPGIARVKKLILGPDYVIWLYEYSVP
jgi:hypothetical protein